MGHSKDKKIYIYNHLLLNIVVKKIAFLRLGDHLKLVRFELQFFIYFKMLKNIIIIIFKNIFHSKIY